MNSGQGVKNSKRAETNLFVDKQKNQDLNPKCWIQMSAKNNNRLEQKVTARYNDKCYQNNETTAKLGVLTLAKKDGTSLILVTGSKSSRGNKCGSENKSRVKSSQYNAESSTSYIDQRTIRMYEQINGEY